METITTILTTTIPPAVTAWLGWYVGKRKQNAEAYASELDNVEKALAIYRNMVNDLSDKIKDFEEQLEHANQKVKELQTQLVKAEELLNQYNLKHQ